MTEYDSENQLSVMKRTASGNFVASKVEARYELESHTPEDIEKRINKFSPVRLGKVAKDISFFAS